MLLLSGERERERERERGNNAWGKHPKGSHWSIIPSILPWRASSTSTALTDHAILLEASSSHYSILVLIGYWLLDWLHHPYRMMIMSYILLDSESFRALAIRRRYAVDWSCRLRLVRFLDSSTIYSLLCLFLFFFFFFLWLRFACSCKKNYQSFGYILHACWRSAWIYVDKLYACTYGGCTT